MANLITRLRSLCQAGTADYTLAGVGYWSDDQLQDRLDARCSLIEGAALTWLPDTVGGGVQAYHRCKQGYRDLETAESGTIYWAIRDSLGALQGTAGYTADYGRGEVRFTADQGGTAYYLTARSYDVYGAAADVWTEKASYYSDWYEYQSEGQKFARQQAYEHAVKTKDEIAKKAGANTGPSELKFAVFQRTDLAPRR